MSSGRRSAILRAEILRGDPAEVTCALEMTEASVFIVTDALPSVGDTVYLRLSFASAVEPLVVGAKVVQVRMSSGPGAPSGFVAEFEHLSDDDRRRVEDLARRLRPCVTAPPSGPAQRELSVLLVEDNQLIRDMFAYAVERYFRQRTGRVHLAPAPSAEAAWALLRGARAFDLALVDHVLPEETGASLVARVRAEPSLRRMSIVGMSVGGPEVRRAMLAAGADIFLEKPIVLKDLFCTLEFLMGASSRSERGVA